ncbi:glycosyltransferase family 1 protein [Labedella populi]|uniref:D-inositol 3-phosphate glycosyltransferase n=1 Tax=Labedella populi TaxID=2498850 RepID=A0A444QC06_9MICO|nr:glycosyltransferase [Labedella populi]RWZ61573.1 glycosyltransferase family 1 protein [Labedella populi]
MRILLWHVHGGWSDAFVRGHHDYLLPRTPDGGAWGLGRGGRPWPDRAVEVAPEDVAEAGVDVVVLQRPEELDVAERLLGRRLGRDVPAVFLEHNTPKPAAVTTRHPLAERSDIPIVHVTHFNDLVWDSGDAPTVVIEHGIPDPGALYTGEMERLTVVTNEPVRRWRITGTDLLPRFLTAGPIDVFGMGTDDLPRAVGATRDDLRPCGDLPTARMHAELARRRVYVHTARWTSLGLSLLEAMHLGMPVVVLGVTEAGRAVPPGAGAISTDIDDLVAAARQLLADPDEARVRGAAARRAALDRYGLDRFLRDWDEVLADVVGTAVGSPATTGSALTGRTAS